MLALLDRFINREQKAEERVGGSKAEELLYNIHQ